MYKWFRKHFIPHKHNNHKPHFLRSKNIRFLALSILLIEICFLTIPTLKIIDYISNNFTALVLPTVLADLTNINREKINLPSLTVNETLNTVASMKAQDMAAKGYFAHISPEGKEPWFWFDKAGYKYEYAGENLAIDFTDSEDVTLAWMNSPTHKANIIKHAYTEMGTGIATGTYEGNPTVFVAQVYAKPLTNNVPITASIASVESNTGENDKIKGATIEKVDDLKSSKFERTISSPRHIINIILIIISILVIGALCLKIFIKFDKKHSRLITNGVVILALIVGIYTLNMYISLNKLKISTSFTSFENK